MGACINWARLALFFRPSLASFAQGLREERITPGRLCSNDRRRRVIRSYFFTHLMQKRYY